MQTCPAPKSLNSKARGISWLSVIVGWAHVNVAWPPVTVSWPVTSCDCQQPQKIRSSHRSSFPLLTRVFKAAALPFPTIVPFRVQVSSWGAALDENSSFQAWFHSGSFWELGKSSQTSKLKTSPHDLPTFSLVRLAGCQSSGTECWLLASFLIAPPTTDTNYTINPIFPNFQAMLTWP